MKQSGKTSWRHVIGLGFLGLQLLSIAYARIAPERFFCWAPYDQHALYKITVEHGGVQLSPPEITSRYHYYSRGWEPRSIHNVISIVRQFESTYGLADDAKVTITYEINGHPRNTWTWPKD